MSEYLPEMADRQSRVGTLGEEVQDAPLTRSIHIGQNLSINLVSPALESSDLPEEYLGMYYWKTEHIPPHFHGPDEGDTVPLDYPFPADLADQLGESVASVTDPVDVQNGGEHSRVEFDLIDGQSGMESYVSLARNLQILSGLEVDEVHWWAWEHVLELPDDLDLSDPETTGDRYVQSGHFLHDMDPPMEDCTIALHPRPRLSLGNIGRGSGPAHLWWYNPHCFTHRFAAYVERIVEAYEDADGTTTGVLDQYPTDTEGTL